MTTNQDLIKFTQKIYSGNVITHKFLYERLQLCDPILDQLVNYLNSNQQKECKILIQTLITLSLEIKHSESLADLDLNNMIKKYETGIPEEEFRKEVSIAGYSDQLLELNFNLVSIIWKNSDLTNESSIENVMDPIDQIAKLTQELTDKIAFVLEIFNDEEQLESKN
ncbi:hypothetical protein M0813_29263 [Anaeramoeba flamelloides]|uniref:Uncharacterized protein n=1 Tax=Anaeramoeba flamelloides TaxID=1746091 RepID=A0ABQ8XPX4_9EUKA|nr:hypothetical protein M0813_29263 [Anaeramoeba flamelloides]